MIAKLVEEATVLESAASCGDSCTVNGKPVAMVMPNALREFATRLREIAGKLTLLISDEPTLKVEEG